MKILVLINYSPKKVETNVELDDNWKIDDVIYGQFNNGAVFDENEALIIKIIKK